MPFGQTQPSPPPDLEPPRRSNPALFVVLGVVVLVGALVIGMQIFGAPAPTPTASATPSSSAPGSPSPSRSGEWIEFEGNGDGVFELVKRQWTADGLAVTIRVEVKRGQYDFSLIAFSNESRKSYNPNNDSTFTASVDEPFEGTFFFKMPRQDSTIVLSTPTGRVALNALPVKG